MPDALSPSEAQLTEFRAGPSSGRVGLVQLLATRESGAMHEFLAQSERALHGVSGKRAYLGALDELPLGEGPAYDVLAIDEFPSRDAALEWIQTPSPDFGPGVARLHVIVARPLGPLPRLGIRAAAAFYRLARNIPVTDAPPFPAELDGASKVESPLPPGALGHAFMAADQNSSLTCLNLNKNAKRARYEEGDPVQGDRDVSGAAAYARYGRVAMPQILGRGGRPLWLGQPEQVLIGSDESPLSEAWESIALVYYPSRLAMRHMLASPEYRSGFHHREAGLERAILIPGIPRPAFDPKR